MQGKVEGARLRGHPCHGPTKLDIPWAILCIIIICIISAPEIESAEKYGEISGGVSHQSLINKIDDNHDRSG